METEAQGIEIQTNAEATKTESMIAELTSRLAAVADLLERAMLERVIPHTSIAASEAVGPIVAMVESSSREAELSHRLADAEKTIAELRASSASHAGRRTLPVSLLARHDGSAPEPGALDAALVSLSLEQRIAVKAQLLRCGLV